MMKSIVYGAGAVGSVLGARLYRNGKSVKLIARSNHVIAIKKNGLVITGIEDYTVPIQATTTPSAVKGADLIFLTVKAQDTETAIHEFAPYLDESAIVISLQNGVRNPEIISRIIGEKRVIPGIVRLSATYLKPGEVIHTHDGICIIGETSGHITKRIEQIGKYMESSVPTRISNDIKAELWGKLILNLVNVPFALTGLPFPKGFDNKYLRRITVEALKEGMRILKTAEIKTEYHNLSPFLELLEDENKTAKWIANEPSTVFSRFVSTHQSVIRNKPDESSLLTGEIVQLGNKNGINTPINSYLLKQMIELRKTIPLKYNEPKVLWKDIAAFT